MLRRELRTRLQESAPGTPVPPSEISSAVRLLREMILCARSLISDRPAEEGVKLAEVEHGQILAKVDEVETEVRRAEATLGEREQLLMEHEARLADFERDLLEREALLNAREQLLGVPRNPVSRPAEISPTPTSTLTAPVAESDVRAPS